MSDNIIQFPGTTPSDSDKNEDQQIPAFGLPNMSADQEKALQVILSGMSFVCVGIKPTDSGADFFTAVDGEEEELRNALPHLDGVIERAYARKGI